MAGRHSAPSHAAPSGRAASSDSRSSRSRERTQGYSSQDYYDEYEDSPVSRSAKSRSTEYNQEYSQPVSAGSRRKNSVREIPNDSDYSRKEYSRSAAALQPADDGAGSRSVRSERPRAPQGRKAEPPKKRGGAGSKDVAIVFSLTVLILVSFSLFHHVLPRMTMSDQVVTPISTYTPSAQVTTPQPIEEQSPEPAETVITETPSEQGEPDTRTEWQKRFADKFTEETVATESSYTSPNVSVTLEKHVEDINGYQQTYYVADIYIASPENIRTYFANNQYTYYGEEDGESMSRNSSAIIAINGDYCNNQKEGILVRNGDVYFTEQTLCDICVLYADGRIETYGPEGYDAAAVLAQAPLQSWKFGPRLLDDNGEPLTSFNTTSVIESEAAPRSGFGYYEPGHYCFVVNDGRQSHSRGMVLSEFAQIFKELGCVRAYNMDGGASSVMTFMGSTYNSPSSYRALGDILLIKETEKEDVE